MECHVIRSVMQLLGSLYRYFKNTTTERTSLFERTLSSILCTGSQEIGVKRNQT